jgi:branched-chain amino acid transport system ATP-binding protein
MTTSLLALNNVESVYGPIKAIRGVSLSVSKGQIVTVLGANGAGKSMILKTISGILTPSKGSVQLRGEEISRAGPANIVRRGVSHVPEGREVFPLLTVCENLLMGAYTRRDRDRVVYDMEAVYSYFPILRERTSQLAGLLSGGQQQMLAISRAILANPELILLDEPSLGLSPRLTKEIFEIVVRINRERGTTILLVEQNANMALNVADHGYVLEYGRIVMEDSCERLREKDDIKEFYLGMKESGVRGGDDGKSGRRGGEGVMHFPALWKLDVSRDPPRLAGDTIHAMFWNGVAARSDEPLMRQKEFEIWRTWTWNEVGEIVRELTMGFVQLGLQPGDCVSVLSNTRVEWVWCDLAILSAGGVSNGIYPTDSASQVQYLCEDSSTVVLVVEDEEQLDKALEVRTHLNRLRKIVVIDPTGLARFSDPMVLTLDELRHLGGSLNETSPATFTQRCNARVASDLAILVYTSGTTGKPKGAMHSHQGLLDVFLIARQAIHGLGQD